METSAASQPLVHLALLVGLSLLPFAFLTCTSFAKMSIVLSVLRNALGTGQAPSGTVLAALAALLTVYVMAPVAEEASIRAAPSLARIDFGRPLGSDEADALVDAVEAGFVPVRAFLGRHAGRRERHMFHELARSMRVGAARDVVGDSDALVILPAFLVTEITEALQMAFVVFVPFLIVDLVVANLLLALGMHMLSPTTVSLPFKLLLFVSVDGFALLSRALVLSYR